MIGKPFEVYSITDSAIDAQAMGTDFREYAKTRDVKLVKVKPGEKVTKFWVRDIPTVLMQNYCKAVATDSERWMRVFAVGCVKVESLIEKGSRTFRDAVIPTGQIASGGAMVSRWTDDELDIIWGAYIDEIGSFVEARSELPLGPEDNFRLPPSSLAVFLRKVPLLAESTPAEPPQPNETSKEAPESPSANAGESPTSAPATASPT